MSEEPKAQYTEEMIHNRPFIVKGKSVNTYESDAIRRKAKDIHARAWYYRVMTLYDNGSWVTLNSRDTGVRFRAYYYSVKYDKKTKKWIWKYTGCYYITMAPNMQHTVKNKWPKPYNNHNRKYTYIYRYEPSTFRKIDAPTPKASFTPQEALSIINPATMLNTLDLNNVLEETFALHSTLSNLSSPFATTNEAPPAEFNVKLAIAMSDVKGVLTAEDEEKIEKFDQSLEKF